MTYVLVIFVSLGSSHSVTHIAGYGSLQACQSALTQVVAPAPLRLMTICISGPAVRPLF